MAATIEILEANGVGETETANITNSNMGSTDAANLVAVDFPVAPGENTFEKWQKLSVTNMGGSSQIDNLKVWRTGALGGTAVHVTNAREATYGGAETYATPVGGVTDSTVATQTMPAAAPTGSNLGIGGLLTGALTATGTSDYLIHQIQSDVTDTAGSSSTLNLQYDEIA